MLQLKKFVFLIWQIYAEMIGNVMIDARSTGKYYHCKYDIFKFLYCCHSSCHQVIPPRKTILLLFETVVDSMVIIP